MDGMRHQWRAVPGQARDTATRHRGSRQEKALGRGTAVTQTPTRQAPLRALTAPKPCPGKSGVARCSSSPRSGVGLPRCSITGSGQKRATPRRGLYQAGRQDHQSRAVDNQAGRPRGTTGPGLTAGGTVDAETLSGHRTPPTATSLIPPGSTLGTRQVRPDEPRHGDRSLAA